MNAKTFTERKNILEEFYKERMKFNIYRIDIIQATPSINIYENHICYAYSYTIRRKFINENFILTKGNSRINYNYEYDNNELYIKDLEIILTTHYDFYYEDYDFYFWALAELEQNNELLVSHTEPINEEVKIINPSKIFKSEECIICLTNQPIILFCNCGHIPICTECYKLKSLSACPVCKTENTILRVIE